MSSLNRFKIAQEYSYEQALAEIRDGKKTSHWMWYIFPQIAGLGKSEVAKKFEIADMQEAEAYLNDELLSQRLLEVTGILAYDIQGKTAQEIFGFPDCLKFHSSLTLFYLVIQAKESWANSTEFTSFKDALSKYFNGELDRLTQEMLGKEG
jgi:uncharacterized protein (DUF1810 family)